MKARFHRKCKKTEVCTTKFKCRFIKSCILKNNSFLTAYVTILFYTYLWTVLNGICKVLLRHLKLLTRQIINEKNIDIFSNILSFLLETKLFKSYFNIQRQTYFYPDKLINKEIHLSHHPFLTSFPKIEITYRGYKNFTSISFIN